MTEQQLTATKALAKRFGSDLAHTDVRHDPFDLPVGWISVVVCRPEPDKAPHLCNVPLIVAGIDPAGNVHS